MWPSVLACQPAAAFFHILDSRGLEAGVSFFGPYGEGFDGEAFAEEALDGGGVDRPRRSGDTGLVVGKGDEQDVAAGSEQ